MAFVKIIYTVHVSLAILNSSTIDFLVALYWIYLYMKTGSKDNIWYFKNKPSWLLGELKLASKTNQFCAQNNVNMKWTQKQFVKHIYIYIYTSKPQMSAPVPNWNPFQHSSACINVYISLIFQQ